MLGNTNITIKPNEKIDYVEWIESTGTQYIDTETIPKATTRVVAKMEFTSSTQTEYAGMFGAQVDGSNTYGYTFTNIPGNTIRFKGSLNYMGGPAYAVNTIYEVDCSLNTYIINGITYTNTDTWSQDMDETIYIWGRNSAGTILDSTLTIGKIYYFKIYENDILIHNFRPCKDPTGVFCLYDTVTKKYFYNKGTGYFEGPNPKQVEYIESSGTQYIDTEILSENTIRTELDFELTSVISSGSVGIAGAYDGSATPYKGLLLGMNAGNFQFAYGSSFNGTTLAPSVGIKYQAIVNSIDKQCIINDTILASTTSLNSNFTVNKTGYLFWTNGGTTNKISMKLYNCRIYNNNDDSLIRNFIPVYIGTYCLYDTVNQKYYYNKGTGVFGGQYLSPYTTVLMHYENNINNEAGLTSHSAVGTIQYGEGVVGAKSLKLNGSSCIKIPYSAPVTFGSSDFTIAGWFKQTSATAGGNYARLWSHQYRYSSSYTLCGVILEAGSTNNIYCTYSNSYSSKVVVSTGNIMPQNKWVHIAFVKKGTTATLYIDGIASGSATVSSSLYQHSSASFKIGAGTTETASNDNPLNYFVGEIDEFIIAKEALWDGNFVPPKAPYGTKEFYDVEV